MTDPGAAVRKRQPFFSVNECEIWKGDPVYKLIVSDIDATLINSKFLIPDYNLEMIRRVREAGIQFMLCTGRLFGSARPYAKFLDLDTPLIMERLPWNGGSGEIYSARRWIRIPVRRYFEYWMKWRCIIISILRIHFIRESRLRRSQDFVS